MKLTENDLRKMVRDQIGSINEASAKDRLNAKTDLMRISNTSTAAAKAIQTLSSIKDTLTGYKDKLTNIKEKLVNLNNDFSKLGVNINVIDIKTLNVIDDSTLHTSIDDAIKKMTDIVSHPGHYVKSAQQMSGDEGSSNKIKLSVTHHKQPSTDNDTLHTLGEKLNRKLRQ